MIHIPIIGKTITSKPAEPDERLKPILSEIAAISNTPEWQAYLLGLQEKEDKKKKRPKSGKNNV